MIKVMIKWAWHMVESLVHNFCGVAYTAICLVENKDGRLPTVQKTASTTNTSNPTYGFMQRCHLHVHVCMPFGMYKEAENFHNTQHAHHAHTLTHTPHPFTHFTHLLVHSHSHVHYTYTTSIYACMYMHHIYIIHMH